MWENGVKKGADERLGNLCCSIAGEMHMMAGMQAARPMCPPDKNARQGSMRRRRTMLALMGAVKSSSPSMF